MDKENFIALLQRNDPVEIRTFLERKSKRKKINPIIEFEEIPPGTDINEPDKKKKKVITAKADDIKEV